MEVAFISRFDNRKPKQPDELVNEKIRFKEVLVIDQNGERLGVKSRNQAIDLAYNEGLDLVCVAPNANHQYVELWILENIVLNSKRKLKK